MNDKSKTQTGKLLYGNWAWEGKEDGLNKSIIISIVMFFQIWHTQMMKMNNFKESFYPKTLTLLL